MKKNSKKKNKFNFKKIDKQDKALLGTIGLLIILVVILTLVALNLKNNEQNQKANIVIPVLEEQTKNEISVDLSDMTKGETKEYIFKVSNYKQGTVNSKNVEYDIIITSSESATIELYKDDSKDNLLKNNVLTIENNILEKGKKIEDEYHLIIKATNEPSETDKITLQINS